MSYDSGFVKFLAYKNGKEIVVTWAGTPKFKTCSENAPIPESRVVSVDTESLTFKGQLTTLLLPIAYQGGTQVIETPTGKNVLQDLCEWLFLNPDFTECYGIESALTQRKKGVKGRPGRRHTLKPVLTVWYNFEYDFGRIAGDLPEIQRAVRRGCDSYRVKVGRFTVEVVRMVFGAAPNFEWIIRDDTKRAIRLIGIDMFGYWKKGLDAAASALSVGKKDDVKSELGGAVFERTRESFSAREWEIFKRYSETDAHLTREIYLATVELLLQVDAHVVRPSGLIPFSIPGAAARIAFAQVEQCHEGIEEWFRYHAKYDQMGLDAYRAGRSFCHRPGVYKNMISLDVVSMYPYTTSLLPDPVMLRVIDVSPTAECSDASILEEYAGLFGVLYIDGESLDDQNPPFRVHGKTKLQYVYGRFTDQAVTIPEIVIGVARGALRVDRISRGCIMAGTPERSFLRASLSKFFKIKSDADAEIERLTNEAAPEEVIARFRALREIGKLLANSLYGKLVQINTGAESVPEMVVPVFEKRRLVARSIKRLMAEQPDTLDDKFYCGETEAQRETVRRSYETQQRVPGMTEGDYIQIYITALLDGNVARSEMDMKLSDYMKLVKVGTAGHHFMPLYAAQITGLASAMLACMSSCIGALQGDTDSVHFVLPEHLTPKDIEKVPGYSSYYRIMKSAGYPTPRFVGGELIDGVPGMADAGTWKVEQSSGSDESILVTLKRYSHKFGDAYKQAQHTFSKFHDPELDKAREAKKNPKELKKIRGRLLHERMRDLVHGRTVQYMGKRSPRKLVDAIRRGLTIGEFVSDARTVEPPTTDPNTWTDSYGYVRWKPLRWEESPVVDDSSEAAE